MKVETSDVAERRADAPPLVELYRLMVLIRRFEDRAAELFEQGVIVGTAHSCVGQEAIAVERHASHGLPRRASPLARSPDRGRSRSPADDGRDVR
jgi:TPP-dependent pyruvate/acetoin dehydrogenase alpha subunit